MKIQRILYNQLNTVYLDKSADYFLYIHSNKKPISPYGVLELNPYSKDIEYHASKNFIKELQNTGKKAKWLSVHDYATGILSVSKEIGSTSIVMMKSSEPIINKQVEKIKQKLEKENITIQITPNTQFLLSQTEYRKKFAKPPIMETFYRRMRKEKNILIDNNKPKGGRWNYDKQNRKFDKKHTATTKKIVYPYSRKDALQLLDTFIADKLDRFGTLEDAMYSYDDTVYHSLISTSLNFGLLTPQEVIEKVEEADTKINNKEGFIRQVLGRREYMYHWFCYYQDSIYTKNKLKNTIPLPNRFRRPEDSPLQMYCINHVLKTVKNTGYSHHITRLMIVGNFCLLMGYNPHHVNKRFWEMYADAFERVVTPNVIGMSQFADGGNLATKPYISSANYINKMSDYCSKCYYDPKEKSGDKACPMNYLYRNFIDKHKDLFKRQPYIIKNLERIDKKIIKKQAEDFIKKITT